MVQDNVAWMLQGYVFFRVYFEVYLLGISLRASVLLVQTIGQYQSLN